MRLSDQSSTAVIKRKNRTITMKVLVEQAKLIDIISWEIERKRFATAVPMSLQIFLWKLSEITAYMADVPDQVWQ